MANVFFSERLQYSKFRPEEYSFYHQLSADPEIMKYITGRPLLKFESKERFQKILAVNEKVGLPGVFIVREKGSGEFCGLAKATIYADQEVEIGYALLPDFWSKGLGTEISKAMVEYGKKIPGTKNLIGIIDPENLASKRILEKCGLSFFEEKMMNDLPGAIYKLKIS